MNVKDVLNTDDKTCRVTYLWRLWWFLLNMSVRYISFARDLTSHKLVFSDLHNILLIETELSLEFPTDCDSFKIVCILPFPFWNRLRNIGEREREILGCVAFLHITWRRLREVLIHFVGKNEEEFNFLFILLLDASNDRGLLTFMFLKRFHMKVIFKETANNPGNLECVWGTFQGDLCILGEIRTTSMEGEIQMYNWHLVVKDLPVNPPWTLWTKDKAVSVDNADFFLSFLLCGCS